MDDFTGLLARDFGLKPQGKSAPMASQSNSSASDFNSFASSYNFATGKKSDSSPVFDDLGRDGDDLLFKDVFSAPPPKYGSSSGDSRSPSAPAFDYDAMFKEPKSKSASMPVFDKPVYDDEDVFESIPELKIPSTSSQSARFENVFSSMSSPAKHRKQDSSPFDDLMGNNTGKRETGSDRESKGSSVFDDLIPGFGRTSSPPPKRSTSETSQSQKPYQPAKTSSSLVEDDPFVVLEESASSPREPPMGGFNDPLEDLGKYNSSSSRKTDHPSVHGGVFVDIDPLDGLGKSGPDMNSRNESHLRPPGNISGSQSPVESSRSYHSKKVSFDDVPEPQNTSIPPPTNTEGSFESSDDVWLTVSEIPLFTQPTSAPPPARPPPPRPTRAVRKKVNEPSLSSPARASVNSPPASQMDELDDFSIGRNQTSANGHPEPPSGEDSDVFSTAAASAAAMKAAMDKAEAKFRHAKERREKENLKASRSREGDHTENHDSRERELREKQVRLERERAEMEKAQEKEREEREREQKRIERERERLLARQAVERATREARERAATEAHAKVQRAAVGKATDARERAERAAVQRAHAEARERAAAGARERAEKAAAEAKERANAETREKEAKARAERAAVERAAAEARGRAAAQAKAKQQQENNDLDSFFNSVSRPSSVPRQRTNPLDPFQDSWNKSGSFESSRESSRVPSGATENLRKTSSATNIVDDLSSIFGAPASQSGGFQDVDGETEERRRARLERHQRTQERAAKALAEKNERDLQLQREQAEKDRIGVTLDVEIKRWGAGKEGNLRALLSTLQYVLWPECGWQPVSLTDLITAASVKKVYRKATLCIHPDKVQQKGANLQQKYIAEKVFDMLKEAWNKFNSEELF
ncbi:auxilin-related protein 2 isoform X1 [Capsella rubella]|uniref:auxilin-related protein 2 isoform X1 n=1 Tax=Capsella rubella TaxID=81985 RepID=UPI000CD5628F|nr:auxilin-related protein 2 isoform X1 [Capsella rubella]